MKAEEREDNMVQEKRRNTGGRKGSLCYFSVVCFCERMYMGEHIRVYLGYCTALCDLLTLKTVNLRERERERERERGEGEIEYIYVCLCCAYVAQK